MVGQSGRTLDGRLRAGRLGRLDRLDRRGDAGAGRAAKVADVDSKWNVVGGGWVGGPGRGAFGGVQRRRRRQQRRQRQRSVVGRDSPPREAMDFDLVDRLDMRLGGVALAGVKPDEGSVTRRRKKSRADSPPRH